MFYVLPRLFSIISAIAIMALAFVAQAMPPMETKADQAVVVDFATDTVLFTKNAFKPMYPASMTKMMTAHILFEQLQTGKLKLDDTFPVSEGAWRKGGSKMFVKVNDRVKVKDLLRGIIVQSGNDACIVVAEGISGSEEAFAELMNHKAKEMGLMHSHFKNSTGWPDEEHVMSPHDLYLLAKDTIGNYPEYYPIYAEKSFTYAGIKQPNRNWLLKRGIGVDGLKTGHTEASGYGIVISGVNPDDGRRIIVVVNGLGSERERAEESQRLLQWAYRSFENKTLWKAGEEVARAEVWMGNQANVPLVSAGDITLTLPKGGKDVQLTVNYEGPIPTPVKQGDEVAKLTVLVPGQEAHTVPLIAGADVDALSGMGRIVPALKYYLMGSAPASEPQAAE